MRKRLTALSTAPIIPTGLSFPIANVYITQFDDFFNTYEVTNTLGVLWPAEAFRTFPSSPFSIGTPRSFPYLLCERSTIIALNSPPKNSPACHIRTNTDIYLQNQATLRKSGPTSHRKIETPHRTQLGSCAVGTVTTISFTMCSNLSSITTVHLSFGYPTCQVN